MRHFMESFVMGGIGLTMTRGVLIAVRAGRTRILHFSKRTTNSICFNKALRTELADRSNQEELYLR